MIRQFTADLEHQGLASRTIESYLTDVSQFTDYLLSMGVTDPTHLKRFYITSYLTQLVEKNYCVASINKKINSLHSYNQFLLDQGILTQPVINPKKDRIKIAAGSKGDVEVFTDDEITRLLFHIQDRNRVSLRNHLIVALLLYTGVRVSELVDIRLHDIDFLTSGLKVTGKGGKYREVPLRSDGAEITKEYTKTERQDSQYRDSPYLLLSQRAPKMHRVAVNRLLRHIGRQLGIDMYPHKFRHTFATMLLRKGVPLTTVSRLAGHSSIQTTSTFYINTSEKDKADAVNLL